MSRVVFTSDIHFGSGTHLGKIDPSTGLNTRFLDFVNTFDKIISYLIENKINVFFIAGDIYKHRQPTPTQQMYFSKALKRLSDNKINTFITLGNHDIVMNYGKAHAISVFESLDIPYINVISELSVLDMSEYGVESIFVCAPYMNKQTDPYSSNEEFLLSLGKKIKRKIKDINNVKNLPVVMVGHNILEGTSVADIQPDVNVLNEPTFTVSFFEENCIDAAFFGHVHEHKVISKNPLVVSLGSMERIDFADANRDKLITVLDVKDMSLETEEITSKDFLNIKINLENFSGEDINDSIVDKLLEYELENKIVRLMLRLKKQSSALIDRDRIQSILNRAEFNTGIHYKFIVSTSEEKIEKKSVTSSSFIDEYLGRLEIDEDRAKDIKSLAMSILEEVSQSRRAVT